VSVTVKRSWSMHADNVSEVSVQWILHAEDTQSVAQCATENCITDSAIAPTICDGVLSIHFLSQCTVLFAWLLVYDCRHMTASRVCLWWNHATNRGRRFLLLLFVAVVSVDRWDSMVTNRLHSILFLSTSPVSHFFVASTWRPTSMQDDTRSPPPSPTRASSASSTPALCTRARIYN